MQRRIAIGICAAALLFSTFIPQTTMAVSVLSVEDACKVVGGSCKQKITGLSGSSACCAVCWSLLLPYGLNGFQFNYDKGDTHQAIRVQCKCPQGKYYRMQKCTTSEYEPDEGDD